ncbi:MAG TPA: polysaccharide deacetylase family protein [Myxococcales bacterium]|nr:polysaccharide deacetylase family protein [Myxococcales bacterium]
MKLLLLLAIASACKPPVPIVNYHSVGEAHDEYSISATQLAAQLDLLAAKQRRTISLHDLAEGKFANGDVVLTFDDGFADALTVVLPLLLQRHMRATFFIVPAFVGHPGFLDWDGVRALQAAGMEIGSHTVDHARLGDLPDGRVAWELKESKRILEEQLHAPVEAIAYPFNSVRARILEDAREAGYRIGVSGPAHGGGDPLNLARISIKSGITLDAFGHEL